MIDDGRVLRDASAAEGCDLARRKVPAGSQLPADRVPSSRINGAPARCHRRATLAKSQRALSSPWRTREVNLETPKCRRGRLDETRLSLSEVASACDLSDADLADYLTGRLDDVPSRWRFWSGKRASGADVIEFLITNQLAHLAALTAGHPMPSEIVDATRERVAAEGLSLGEALADPRFLVRWASSPLS